MSDSDPTQDQREERYKTKNGKTGLVRANFWLPEYKVESYKKRAERDRAEHRKKLGFEK